MAAVSKQIKKSGFFFKKYLVKFKSDPSSFDDILAIAKKLNTEIRNKMSLKKLGKVPWNKGKPGG